MLEIHRGMIVYISSLIFIKSLRKQSLKPIECSLSILLVGYLHTFKTLRRYQELDSESHEDLNETKVYADKKKEAIKSIDDLLSIYTFLDTTQGPKRKLTLRST